MKITLLGFLTVCIFASAFIGGSLAATSCKQNEKQTDSISINKIKDTSINVIRKSIEDNAIKSKKVAQSYYDNCYNLSTYIRNFNHKKSLSKDSTYLSYIKNLDASFSFPVKDFFYLRNTDVDKYNERMVFGLKHWPTKSHLTLDSTNSHIIFYMNSKINNLEKGDIDSVKIIVTTKPNIQEVIKLDSNYKIYYIRDFRSK